MLLAEIVAEESGGRLQPQIATRARPYTLLGGLNEDGQTMSVLPNFPARVDTVTQIMMGSPVPACCMSSARGRQSTCPHQRRWESYVTTLSLTEPAKRAAIQAAEHRLQHGVLRAAADQHIGHEDHRTILRVANVYSTGWLDLRALRVRHAAATVRPRQ